MKMNEVGAIGGVFYLCLASFVVGVLAASTTLTAQERFWGWIGLGFLFCMAYIMFGLGRNPRWPLKAKSIPN